MTNEGQNFMQVPVEVCPESCIISRINRVSVRRADGQEKPGHNYLAVVDRMDGTGQIIRTEVFFPACAHSVSLALIVVDCAVCCLQVAQEKLLGQRKNSRPI